MYIKSITSKNPLYSSRKGITSSFNKRGTEALNTIDFTKDYKTPV